MKLLAKQYLPSELRYDPYLMRYRPLNLVEGGKNIETFQYFIFIFQVLYGVSGGGGMG